MRATKGLKEVQAVIDEIIAKHEDGEKTCYRLLGAQSMAFAFLKNDTATVSSLFEPAIMEAIESITKPGEQ